MGGHINGVVILMGGRINGVVVLMGWLYLTGWS